MKLRTLWGAIGLLLVSFSAQAAVVFSDNFNAQNGGVPLLNFGAFANWTVSDGTVDLIGPGLFDLLPGSGLYVDLDGNTGNAGRITSAPIFFQSGVTYELRFSIAGSQRGTQESASVGITGLSTGTVSLASATLFTTAGPGFLCLSCSVIGDGAVHSIFFEGLGGDNVGLLLDNVQLSAAVAVPEPATLALLGLALAGLGFARRRKQH